MSDRECEDMRQSALISDAWHESGKVYGYRKLHADLRESGESISLNRVERLAKLAGMVIPPFLGVFETGTYAAICCV